MKPIFLFLLLTLPHMVWAGNVLDKAGNPKATPLVAYSLRQLSSAYTGNAIQVRRSSDNATQDIGFTPAGDLDTATLKAFVGSGTGYVSIWYDQSGNEYNATQKTTTNEPVIISGGVINRDNGQPAVYTSGTGWLSYGPISELSGATPVTRMEVARSRDNTNLNITEGLGAYQLDLQLFPTKVWVQFEDHNITATANVASPTSLMSINSVRNNGASQLYINTALLGSTPGNILPFPAQVTGYIGIRFDYTMTTGGPNLGAFSETILFNSVLSDADRQAINYNENWYYSLGFDVCSSTVTSLSPNATTTPTLTTQALYACMQDASWAYYYDPANPLKLLFGIAKDPGNTSANAPFVADSINLTVFQDPAKNVFAAISGTEAMAALGRYWNVYSHTPLTSPVNVRFFYSPADTMAARKLAQDYKNAVGASMMSNLLWFKTVGVPFTPDSLIATPKAGIRGQTLTLTPVYGTTKDGINYVEFDGITSFSGGTGVYIVSNTVSTLPIIIGSFSGRRVNETTALSWTTETESNSERFEIERSADGSTWTKIGQVTAAGNSSTVLYYHFTDPASLNEGNRLYYRLKLVDNDGRNTYSGVVLIKMDDNTVLQLSRIAPNPFTNNIEVTCTVPVSGRVEVLLQNMTGVTLVRREYIAKKGDNVLKLTDCNQLAQGTYIMRVVQGGAVAFGKVIKK